MPTLSPLWEILEQKGLVHTSGQAGVPQKKAANAACKITAQLKSEHILRWYLRYEAIERKSRLPVHTKQAVEPTA